MESSGFDKQNRAKKRCARTKKDQFELMLSFHNDNNAEVLGTLTYDQRWGDLTKQLNAIGPPNYSGNEWKRIWTERKYNKKRKTSGEGSFDSSKVSVK